MAQVTSAHEQHTAAHELTNGAYAGGSHMSAALLMTNAGALVDKQADSTCPALTHNQGERVTR